MIPEIRKRRIEKNFKRSNYAQNGCLQKSINGKITLSKGYFTINAQYVDNNDKVVMHTLGVKDTKVHHMCDFL